jgi:hypothetical protein
MKCKSGSINPFKKARRLSRPRKKKSWKYEIPNPNPAKRGTKFQINLNPQIPMTEPRDSWRVGNWGVDH